MTTTNTLVKITMETPFPEMKAAAKAVGISPVAKKKEDLVQLVNERIEKIEAGEMTLEEALAAAAPAPREKAKKWYEEEGAVNVAIGNTIQIEKKVIEKGGETKEILQGRYAKVIGFSPKKNMIRALLLHETTGEELNCPITLEVGLFNKVAEDWVFQPPVRETKPETTPEASDTDGDVQDAVVQDAVQEAEALAAEQHEEQAEEANEAV